MVMTLRKRRAPLVLSVIESETESESDSYAPIAAPKAKKKKQSRKEEDEEDISDSESDEGHSDDTDGEKENNVTAGYENIRDQRIRENRERMEKLGIFSLTSQLFTKTNKSKPKPKPKPKPPQRKRYPPLYPRARSNRLMNSGKEYLESEGISIPDTWKTEVYTELDEQLLGDCQTPWTLNVDGFSEDGDRLYDPDGTPCHQCRQKVSGKLTFCGKCRSAQGHLCGDCLYTRYGENVLEAIENPSWLCPVCRGICNCSRCRRTKGWEPINVQYYKIIESGFKSVAHYLILSRRAGTTPKELNDGIATVDLTTEETTVPQQDEGSDYSAESSESDSDNSDSEDDSKGKSKNREQSAEMQVAYAENVVSNEAAVATE